MSSNAKAGELGLVVIGHDGGVKVLTPGVDLNPAKGIGLGDGIAGPNQVVVLTWVPESATARRAQKRELNSVLGVRLPDLRVRARGETLPPKEVYGSLFALSPFNLDRLGRNAVDRVPLIVGTLPDHTVEISFTAGLLDGIVADFESAVLPWYAHGLPMCPAEGAGTLYERFQSATALSQLLCGEFGGRKVVVLEC